MNISKIRCTLTLTIIVSSNIFPTQNKVSELTAKFSTGWVDQRWKKWNVKTKCHEQVKRQNFNIFTSFKGQRTVSFRYIISTILRDERRQIPNKIITKYAILEFFAITYIIIKAHYKHFHSTKCSKVKSEGTYYFNNVTHKYINIMLLTVLLFELVSVDLSQVQLLPLSYVPTFSSSSRASFSGNLFLLWSTRWKLQ